MTDVLGGPSSILGSFEVLEEIGRGGLGVVYRGRHVHLGRLVALKVLHPLWTSTPEFVQRFRDEGRALALLEHPNILRVYDAGEWQGHFFLAMAYLQGQTLEAVMSSRVPVAKGLDYVRQIARALAFAHHHGVIHRDVKPANVMVGADGHVTLMDFGVARLKDTPGMTLPGSRVGTPFYMAPEQIQGCRVDGRVDVYALGVILHQLLSGRLPFPGPSTEEVFEGHVHQEPPALGPAVPEWLRLVVRKALAKDPSARFPDAESLYHALDRVSPVAAKPHRITAALPAESHPPNGAGEKSPSPHAGAPTTREDRTALSLDVVGSAQMKHPGFTQVVQEQFVHFRSYVRRYLDAHGCLEAAWSGDGLLALFARPRDGAACAVDILDGLAALNQLNDPNWEVLNVRIGVHHGPLLRSDVTPLGEVTSRTLDAAGHLQKAAPENTALISEGLYTSLPNPGGWLPAPDELGLSFDFPAYYYPASAGYARRENGADAAPLRLEVISPAGSRAAEVNSEALIGRPDPVSRTAPEIDLRADDAVSRRHARIFRRAGCYFVEDLGSANGTRHNGRWLETDSPALLHSGDTLEVGEETLIRVC